MSDLPTAGNRVVLVAEDDRDIRELVQTKLTGAGFEVLAVGDGMSALATAREHKPDVVLIDVMMPGLSGLDVVELMRADPATAAIPVILLTARSAEFDVEDGMARGAADYIVKPFSPRDLVQRINTVLAQAAR
jgi:DNA-binding response OmpR family regulator